MEHHILDSTPKGSEKAMVYSHGQIKVFIKEILKTIKCMDSGCINGLMDANTKGSGLTLKCMGKENLVGRTAVNILENSSMIERKVKEYLFGLMEGI